jgi:hypothetical protein
MYAGITSLHSKDGDADLVAGMYSREAELVLY